MVNTSAPRIEACRVCGNRSLSTCVDLGSQYPSAVFPESLDYHDKIPRLPLELVMCERRDDRTCGVVQLAHRFDLSSMYEAYPYTSASNSSMVSILRDVAESGRAAVRLRPGDVVLDIGGNDSTLLSCFADGPVDLVCVDPAKNVTPVTTLPRHTQVRAFFTEQVFRSAVGIKAKLIFSVAMFYHLGDPLRFASDVAASLEPEGVWVIQMAYLPAMLRTNMYDNIVHEHAGYYATQHMHWILKRAGLTIFDVTLNDVYGGSFRLLVKHSDGRTHSVTERCQKILRQEIDEGVFDPATYGEFTRRIERTRSDLRELCASLKASGKKIWVYGASTKGNTILQYSGPGKEDIVAAADANPLKIGKFVIGADIPIVDEATLRAAKPDYLLALPYSFVETFIKREADLIGGGTRFIVPLPAVRIVPGT